MYDHFPIISATQLTTPSVDKPPAYTYAHTARGQGVSISGDALKTLGLEVVISFGAPSTIIGRMLAIEIWSDNRSETARDMFREMISV